jgi:hypothetical protein
MIFSEFHKSLTFYFLTCYIGYKVLARNTGSIIITNILKGILGHPDLMSDRIHPNGDGCTIMTKQFYKALTPYF